MINYRCPQSDLAVHLVNHSLGRRGAPEESTPESLELDGQITEASKLLEYVLIFQYELLSTFVDN